MTFVDLDSQGSSPLMRRELASDVVQRLVERYGAMTDVSKLPDSHATVLLVNAVHALVGNGGFQRLLEGDLPGDPTLRFALAAHDRIGATDAAKAIRMAIAVFPRNLLPSDFDQRVEVYSSRYSLMDLLNGKTTPDSIYMKSMKETWRLLEAYVRENQAAFDLS